MRKNTGHSIELTTHGVISGHALDPVEKKPLYHFFPGHNILSVGSYGCNMRCDFCQNWHISQKPARDFAKNCTADELLSEAKLARNNIGLAFTYNEPVIWYEFVLDCAALIKENGFHSAMISNGFINPDPLNELLQYIDAFNIDLKAFNSSFYRKVAGADIEPVKETLKKIARSGRHLEITTLIIPGLNDSVVEMENEAKWISSELGPDIPLHLSRYFPTYKREDPSTPNQVLTDLFEVASAFLNYVYLGNSLSSVGQATKCNKCGTPVTERSGYNIHLLNLDSSGNCEKCGNSVYRNFTFSSHAGR